MARSELRGVWKKTATARASTAIRYEEIARVAYELFEQHGGVHGHDLEDWLEAERIVRQRARSRA